MLCQIPHIVIVGGGLMGATLANFLAPFATITIIDKQTRQSIQDSTHVIALSDGSIERYAHWVSDIDLARFGTPIRQIDTTHQNSMGHVVFRTEDYHRDQLGMVVEARHLIEALFHRIQTQSQHQWLLSTHCSAMRPKDTQIEVDYVNPKGERQTLLADLCLIADGAGSHLVQQLGFGITQYDYQQHAIVGRAHLAASHQGCAYERFLKKGAIALLPLEEKTMAYVLIVDKEEVSHWMSMEASAWLSHLNEQMNYRHGLLVELLSRQPVPLIQTLANATIGHRFLVMGSAAHHIHPVAAQGFNLSVMDADCLATILAVGTKEISAILQQYGQKTQYYDQRVIEAVHGLARLGTATCYTPLKSLGLSLVGLMPSLQSEIAHWSLGDNRGEYA